MASNLSLKRARDESDGSGLDPVEVKRLREDLLDDSYPESANQDLESVIRSLEEEISISISVSDSPAPESGESRPEIGYLLEASDDELGLPPASGEEVPVELGRVESGSTGIGEYCWFDDEFPSYGSIGFGDGGFYAGGEDDYVAVGGLFEHSDDDVVFEGVDFPWHGLPAQ